MEDFWHTSKLSDEILKNDGVFDKVDDLVDAMTNTDITIQSSVENMSGVLTHKEPENREKGMKFFSKLLQKLPRDRLLKTEVKFITDFYTDRLKDHHRIIPYVIEGYLAIIDMQGYDIKSCGSFFTILFRDVPCQSQLKNDRYNIYLIVQKLLDKDIEFMKTLGPDFVYGFILAMDGERDPRNLMLLFSFLPRFISNIPLGHLLEEMFEVISCYYPIDFNPSDDVNAVKRDDLANALAPCLVATPEFGEHCLLLLVDKLDSALRLAKIDSLRLLILSCRKFLPKTYYPFVKTLWASIQKEASHKTDQELKLAALEALHALVGKLATTSNTDQTFENFVKTILLSMQTAFAENSTTTSLELPMKILLTTANASQESCILITKSMIPGTISFFGLTNNSRLHISCLNFLGDLYELNDKWKLLNDLKDSLNEITQLTLIAVSRPEREYQIAGFTLLKRTIKLLQSDLILPFVEVLIYNVHHSKDKELLKICIETVHAIASKYPEEIMQIVLVNKLDLGNFQKDKHLFNKRLSLLSNLASIDEFTKIIIERMLKIIKENDSDAGDVITAMKDSISDVSVYSTEKIENIEKFHSLVDAVLEWLLVAISKNSSEKSLICGYSLISVIVARLTKEMQLNLIQKHTRIILEKIQTHESYFIVLEALYNSLRQGVFCDLFPVVMKLSIQKALISESILIQEKSCILLAHLLNKVGEDNFDQLYEILKEEIQNSKKMEDNSGLCEKIIGICAWVTKALILRGHEDFQVWLKKIITALSSPIWCKNASHSIKLIMSENPEALSRDCHCKISLLYKQRVFNVFLTLTEEMSFSESTKEAFLLSWAYILEKVPRNVLKNEVDKILPLVVDSLQINNKDLLVVMLSIVRELSADKHTRLADSMQTLLPRLVDLTTFDESMDVRIATLECLYEIANAYPTALLLPYRDNVAFNLAPSLDDKKRLVRAAAVKARTRWYLVGAPGEEKPN